MRVKIALPIVVQTAIGNAWPANCVAAKQENATARHAEWHANAFPCVSLNSVITVYTHAVAKRKGTDIIKPGKKISLPYKYKYHL